MTDCTCTNFPGALGPITFGGNVGIGVSAAPLTTLEVEGQTGLHLRSLAGSPEGGRLTFFGDGTGWRWELQARKDDGTLVGSPILTAVDSGTVGGGSTSAVRVFPTGGSISSLEAFATTDPSLATGYSRLRLTVDGTTAWLIADASGGPAPLPLAVQVGGAERLRITTAGNVGIGTSSPTFPLEVATGAAKLDFGLVLGPNTQGQAPGIHADPNSLYLEANVGNLYLRPQGTGNNTNAAVLTSQGYLGIGLPGLNPAYPLDVSGTIRTGSGLIAGGAILLPIAAVAGLMDSSGTKRIADENGCYYAS